MLYGLKNMTQFNLSLINVKCKQANLVTLGQSSASCSSVSNLCAKLNLPAELSSYQHESDFSKKVQ